MLTEQSDRDTVSRDAFSNSPSQPNLAGDTGAAFGQGLSQRLPSTWAQREDHPHQLPLRPQPGARAVLPARRHYFGQSLDQRALNRLSTELLERGPAGRPLSRFSVASYLNAINLFLGWAGREGELDSKVRAQTPRLPRRILEVLSREEIERLEDAAKTERDKLMVRVLADSGLRASELLGLCVAT